MEKITEKDLFKELDFTDLKRGDIIQHKVLGVSYVVTSLNKNEAIAVRQIKVTNKSDWRVLK